MQRNRVLSGCANPGDVRWAGLGVAPGGLCSDIYAAPCTALLTHEVNVGILYQWSNTSRECALLPGVGAG